MSWLHLEGKTAIVTGGASGIGKAVAEGFLEQGANVVVCDMNPEAPTFEDKRGKMLYIVTDVTKRASVEAMVEKAKKRFGSIDILVNNAGITRDNLLMRMKEEEWDDIMQVNLKSVFRASKAVLRGMMKQRAGRIITITSVVGTMGNAGQTNYAAAKAGLMGFSKSLAREVGSRGITVNCVAPGLIDTEILDENVPVEEILKAIPAQRMGLPEEVAHAVRFLMSEHAAYITRQVIAVNGGLC